MDNTKPYKGTLDQWALHEQLGQPFLTGRFIGHQDFDGRHGHTSYIVSDIAALKQGDEVETRNSRYTLGVPA